MSDILTASSIDILPTRQRCRLNETHAKGVLTSIFKANGPEHIHLVLNCVTANPANRNALWSETIGAVSDAILFHSTIGAEGFVNAFARIDLQWHRARIVRPRRSLCERRSDPSSIRILSDISGWTQLSDRKDRA